MVQIEPGVHKLLATIKPVVTSSGLWAAGTEESDCVPAVRLWTHSL